MSNSLENDCNVAKWLLIVSLSFIYCVFLVNSVPTNYLKYTLHSRIGKALTMSLLIVLCLTYKTFAILMVTALSYSLFELHNRECKKNV